MSNRVQTVPKAMLHGSIHGVMFGLEVWAVARSPEYLLIWDGGHGFQSGRDWHYGRSSLHLVARERIRRGKFAGMYRTLLNGGRLTSKRLAEHAPVLTELFGDDGLEAIRLAVDRRQSVIIEGGGKTPRPSGKDGGWASLAYKTWLDDPNKDL